MSEVTIFACRRSAARCKCGRRALAHCDFELTGPKGGTRCDAPLCAWCVVVDASGRRLCQPHHRLEEGKSA